MSQPHDRFVRHAFSYPDLARDFFSLFLGEIGERIDLGSLKHEPDSEVGNTLDKTMTDVLFSAAIRDYPAYLYLLLEHKSEGTQRGSGASLPWQIHVQEVALMERHRRNHDRLPLIVAIGLFHGEKPYPGPRSIAEVIDAPGEMIPTQWQQKIHLIDLSDYSDEELLQKGKLSVFLLVLKHAYDPRIEKLLEKLGPLMREIDRETNGMGFIHAVLEYLARTAPQEIKPRLPELTVQYVSEKVGAEVMTIAESWIQEGIEQGVEKKNREIVLRMISQGFDTTTIMNVTQLSKEQMDQFLKKEDQDTDQQQ